MLLGYNSNGLAHHDPLTAIEVLAEIGYACVAVTLDHHWLNPYSKDLSQQVTAFAKALERHNMKVVIETGARFLLDPRRKHWPSLVADRQTAAKRIDFIVRAAAIARDLGAGVVSIWSGAQLKESPDAESWTNLVGNLGRILDNATTYGVTIGFEPEPGMFVDTLASFRQLQEKMSAPGLRLTMDIGHLHCQRETPIADRIREWKDQIVNVHIEDMRVGIHDHLLFGAGEIDFPPVVSALQEIDYSGPLCVELSRHSFDAVNAANASFVFLRSLL